VRAVTGDENKEEDEDEDGKLGVIVDCAPSNKFIAFGNFPLDGI